MAPLCRVLTLFRKIDRKCTTYELFKEDMEWNFRSEEEKKGGSAAGLAILHVKPSAKWKRRAVCSNSKYFKTLNTEQSTKHGTLLSPGLCVTIQVMLIEPALVRSWDWREQKKESSIFPCFPPSFYPTLNYVVIRGDPLSRGHGCTS